MTRNNSNGPADRPRFVTAEHLGFFDTLEDDGLVDMREKAAALFVEAFPDRSLADGRDALRYWFDVRYHS